MKRRELMHLHRRATFRDRTGRPRHSREFRTVRRLFQLLIALTVVIAWSATSTRAQETARERLYERIGRYDAIAAMMGDFVEKLTTDPQFSRYFAKFDTKAKN